MTSDLTAYRSFLESKAVTAPVTGYDGPLTINPKLKPHARDIAEWMIRGGNRACFARKICWTCQMWRSDEGL